MFSILAGFLAGWITVNHLQAKRLESVVAFSWGDGRYGNGFYGAHVFLKPSGSNYSVRGRVYIGRGNNYFHDLGELGKTQTPEEAVQRFGVIQWRAEGLYIGDGSKFPIVLERSKLESHR